MKFTWLYEKKEQQQLKYFLKDKGISKKLLAKIKFQNGRLSVNGKEQNVLHILTQGDEVHVEIPDEGEHETLLRDETQIEIVFEDEHFLVVNKPSNVASIPAQYHPNGTMANRVKHYYCQQGYSNCIIHVVTRLDRDTTGLMLFAKHGYAHALLDRALREKKLIKIYTALVQNKQGLLPKHSFIQKNIARDMSSLLKRQVSEEGKSAVTEYWVKGYNNDTSIVDIQLHTGRTHQIRVHFSSIEAPLLGDELYNGNMEQGIQRQALHCSQLIFFHPFLQKEVNLKLSLPMDMMRVIEQFGIPLKNS